MSLLEAIKRFRAAGGTVEVPRRTGELIFTHNKSPLRCRVNGRRKDVPRSLKLFLKRLDIR